MNQGSLLGLGMKVGTLEFGVSRRAYAMRFVFFRSIFFRVLSPS